MFSDTCAPSIIQERHLADIITIDVVSTVELESYNSQ